MVTAEPPSLTQVLIFDTKNRALELERENYWDSVINRHTSSSLWRSYCDQLSRSLLPQKGERYYRRALKTDLFEEAIGVGLLSDLEDIAARVHGIDISANAVASAARKNVQAVLTQQDVRTLSFPDEHFDLIVSTSTLDHFRKPEDLRKSFAELDRVLVPGGTLVLTLDNPGNPVVVLRNRLQKIAALSFAPYFVGHTLNLKSLCDLVSEFGLSIEISQQVMHVPRLPAIIFCRLLEAAGLQSIVDCAVPALFNAFERLRHWPTAGFTGYFVMCRVSKPESRL